MMQLHSTTTTTTTNSNTQRGGARHRSSSLRRLPLTEAALSWQKQCHEGPCVHASTSSEVAANKVMLACSHTLCARCMPRLTGRISCNSSMLAHLMSEWFFRLSSSTVRWTFLCGDGCASVTDPGNLVAGVQIIPQGCACSRARSLEENVEVTQFFPLERIDAVPVPQIRNKLWESQSTFHKSGISASQS